MVKVVINILRLKEYLYIYALIFPMIARWLFLSSWENALTIDMLGYPLFLPELAYLALPFLKPNRKQYNLNILIVAMIWLLVNLISNIFSDSTTKYFNLLAGSDFFFVLFIIGLFPLSKNYKNIIRWPFLLALLAIGLEIIMFSTGVLVYDKEIGGAYTSFMRISTTVGAATGTGVIVFMLGAATYFCFDDKIKFKRAILIFTTVSIFFTLSKGTILCQFIYLSYVLFNKPIPRFTTKLQFLQIILITAFILFGSIYINNKYQVFDIFADRIEQFFTEDDKTASTGARIERMQDSFKLFCEKPVIGHGSNYQMKYGRGFYMNNFNTLASYSPHNTFLLIMVDYGILGLITLLLLFIATFGKFRCNNSIQGKSLKLAISVCCIILMSVEVVFLTMFYLFMLILMVDMLNKQKN